MRELAVRGCTGRASWTIRGRSESVCRQRMFSNGFGTLHPVSNSVPGILFETARSEKDPEQQRLSLIMSVDAG